MTLLINKFYQNSRLAISTKLSMLSHKMRSVGSKKTFWQPALSNDQRLPASLHASW